MKPQNTTISMLSEDPVQDPPWTIFTVIILTEIRESWGYFSIFQNWTIFFLQLCQCLPYKTKPHMYKTATGTHE